MSGRVRSLSGSAHHKRIFRVRLAADPYRLRLLPFGESVAAAFAADSATLIPTERCRRPPDPIGVDPDSSGLQALRSAQRAPDVGGPNPRRQSIRGVIGDLI